MYNNDIHNIKELKFDRVTDGVEAARIGFDASEATQLNINNYSGTGSVSISTGQTGGAYSGNLERIKVVGRDAEILNIETITSNADNNVFTNGATFNADVDLSDAGKVINMIDPTNDQDGATKAYVDSATDLSSVDVISFTADTGSKLQFYGPDCEYCIGIASYEIYINTARVFRVSRDDVNTQILTDINDNVFIPNGNLGMNNNRIVNLADSTVPTDGLSFGFGRRHFGLYSNTLAGSVPSPSTGYYAVLPWDLDLDMVSDAYGDKYRLTVNLLCRSILHDNTETIGAKLSTSITLSNESVVNTDYEYQFKKCVDTPVTDEVNVCYSFIEELDYLGATATFDTIRVKIDSANKALSYVKVSYDIQQISNIF